MWVLLITHNIGIMARAAQRIARDVSSARSWRRRRQRSSLQGRSTPYTRGLLGSIPRLGRRSREPLEPEFAAMCPPALAVVPGCAFHPRCPDAVAGLCDRVAPLLAEVAPGHKSSCLLEPEVAALSLAAMGKAS